MGCSSSLMFFNAYFIGCHHRISLVVIFLRSVNGNFAISMQECTPNSLGNLRKQIARWKPEAEWQK